MYQSEPIRIDEVRASPVDIANADTIALTYNIWLKLLYDSPDLSGITNDDLRKGTMWWRNYFVTTPYKIVVKSLDTLSHALQKETKRVKGLPSIGRFLPWIAKLPLVGKVYATWYQRSISQSHEYQDDKSRFKWLITFLKMGKKAVVVDPELTDIALREVMADEQDLKALRTSKRLLEDTQMVYHALFPRFVDESAHFRNGNGNVASGSDSLLTKLNEPFMLSLKMARKYMLADSKWMVSHRNAYGYGPNCFKSLSVKTVCCLESDFVTEGHVVAKDANAVRFIGHEPMSKMALQQSVFYMFVKTFRQTYVANSIDLADQTRSRLATLVASSTGLSSTIDLSRASNRLSKKNIEAIVPNSILSHLDAARTQFLRVGEEVVKLQMYSTMGSAVTFPLQTSVFYALTVLAILYHYYGVIQENPHISRNAVPQTPFAPEKPWDVIGMHTSLPIFTHETLGVWLKNHIAYDIAYNGRRRYTRFFVYGDDIIVPSSVTDILIALLTDFGLVVNTAKSFVGDDGVRESCGLFALFGVEFTPELLKTPSFKGEMPIEVVQSLVGFANRLGKALIFPETRKYVIHLLLQSKIRGNVPTRNGMNCIQFTHDPEDNSRIYTTTPDLNWHLEKREFDKNLIGREDASTRTTLMRNEVRGFVIEPIYEEEETALAESLTDQVELYRFAQAGRLFRREWDDQTYEEWRSTGVDRGWEYSLSNIDASISIPANWHKLARQKRPVSVPDYRKPRSYRTRVGWTPHCLQ